MPNWCRIPKASLRGSTGIQFLHRDFFAVGEEAYVPPNLTDQVAIFTLQEFGTGPVQIEAAARAEFTDVEAQTIGIARDYETFSGALGVVYQGIEGVRIGLNGSRAERAPSAEELFSDGPHIATQAFEIGDVNLDSESAWGLEAYARGNIGAGTFNLHRLQAVVRQLHLPQRKRALRKTDLAGVRISPAGCRLLRDRGGFLLSCRRHRRFPPADQICAPPIVEAEFADGTAAPRIPPLEPARRARGAKRKPSTCAARCSGSTSRTGSPPSKPRPTASRWSTRWWRGGRWQTNQNVTVQLAADNIFDVNGRRHASFTKDFVPPDGPQTSAPACA